MKKTIIILMLAAMLCLTACAAPAMEAPELLEPVGVKLNTVMVQRGEICEMASYEYCVTPETEEVLFDVDGQVEQVCVAIGQQVKAGDALVQLDVNSAVEQIEEIDEQLAFLEKDNALTLQMLKIDVDRCKMEMEEDNRDYAYGTKKEQEKYDEYNRVVAAYTQEQERQELERQQLLQSRKALQEMVDTSVLTAPFDGMVVYVSDLAPGMVVRNGETAVMIAVDELQLSGEYLSDTQVENAAEIQAYINGQFYDVVYQPMDSKEYVSIVLSGLELTSTFTFADGAPENVQAGDYALILVKSRQRKDVLYLPPNALARDAVSEYVYVNDGEGGRERVNIETGIRTVTAVEISEGLKEGDEVYVLQ